MLFLEMVKLAYTKLPYNLELEPYSLEIYTGCANMNFVKAFKSYRLTDRQTDRQTRPKLYIMPFPFLLPRVEWTLDMGQSLTLIYVFI